MRASGRYLALILALVMALAVMPLVGCSTDSGGGDDEATEADDGGEGRPLPHRGGTVAVGTVRGFG